MPLPDPTEGHCQPDSDPRLSDEEAARIAGEQYTGKPYSRPGTGFQDETLIPVDVDKVMRDPVLKAMPDGPAKRFLLALGHELDHDPTEPPPQLIVRRR